MAETTTRTVQVRIMDVRRQLNTPAGNPVYKLIGRNGSFTTEPDASVGYEVRDRIPLRPLRAPPGLTCSKMNT